MYTQNVFLTVLLACLALCGSSWASPSPTLGESKFLLAMRSSSVMAQNDPAQALQCFQYYSEVFDQLLRKYEQEFADCLNTSQLQQQVLDERYRPILLALNHTAVDACDQLLSCSHESSLDGLSCYADEGQTNVRVMYNISSSASASYAQLLQAVQLVQFTEEQCGNTSKRNYELGSDQAYIRLQNCLAGLEPVPTALSSTTTTEIIDTTTTSESTTTTSPATTATTQKKRRTLWPRRTTTPIPYSTSAAPGSKSALNAELQKWLHSLTQ